MDQETDADSGVKLRAQKDEDELGLSDERLVETWQEFDDDCPWLAQQFTTRPENAGIKGGRYARDIVEFLEILKQVSKASIFHHMHQYFLKPHVRPPEYSNDFAVWVAEAVEDKVLAELLANLNPFEFSKIDDIRQEMVRIITDYLKERPVPRPVMDGKEFFFNESRMLVIPTGFEASSVEEFIEALRQVDNSSIYFHFYEARLRLGQEQDDFSRFFRDCLAGECPGLADELRSLDPYMYTTDVLRSKVEAMVARRCGR